VLDIDGRYLIESVAIIEWLDEVFPRKHLYPDDPIEKARVRALCEVINADTQPIQNLTVMDYYSDDPEKRKKWNQHFITRGLNAYETLVSSTAGRFSFGDSVTAADLFLIPQVYNALRFELDISQFPRVEQIYHRAIELAEVVASHPDRYKP
jgi:maleylacetoacetate isomerase